MKKILLLILLAMGGLLAGCNGGPQPKPDHYQEDIDADQDTTNWW